MQVECQRKCHCERSEAIWSGHVRRTSEVRRTSHVPCHVDANEAKRNISVDEILRGFAGQNDSPLCHAERSKAISRRGDCSVAARLAVTDGMGAYASPKGQ